MTTDHSLNARNRVIDPDGYGEGRSRLRGNTSAPALLLPIVVFNAPPAVAEGSAPVIFDSAVVRRVDGQPK